jgi:hypothetical protein
MDVTPPDTGLDDLVNCLAELGRRPSGLFASGVPFSIEFLPIEFDRADIGSVKSGGVSDRTDLLRDLLSLLLFGCGTGGGSISERLSSASDGCRVPIPDKPSLSSCLME